MRPEPSARGAETLAMVKAALRWMFTRTDALELWTRAPEGNLGARALARAIGGVLECRLKRGWVMDHATIPAEIYSLKIQDWMRSATDLEAVGRGFHDRLESEYERLGAVIEMHDDDDLHDRNVGIAVEMIKGGQVGKATVFYNRFASMARYKPMSIVSLNPVAIDFQEAILIVADDSFWVACTRSQPQQVGSV